MSFPTQSADTVQLPLDRLFSTPGTHKVLDQLFAKPDQWHYVYELGMSAGLNVNELYAILNKLSAEELIFADGSNMKIGLETENPRVIPLINYYTETINEPANKKKKEDKKRVTSLKVRADLFQHQEPQNYPVESEIKT